MMMKAKFDLFGSTSTGSVKRCWQKLHCLKWGKGFNVLFKKPFTSLLLPVLETSSCDSASWIPHLFLSLMLLPAPILTLLLYSLTPVGRGVCGKEAVYYKK